MMRLDENLFEALTEETSDRNKVGGKEIAKQQAIKEMANIDFEVGHTFDPDDFNYFKKVCKEDGWNVTEEDFQKYFEYLDEIRANRFADEDSDIGLGGWEEMESKQVEDSDGFMTDYTWYVKDNEDGSETHVMIFGDQDLYTPMNSEPDAEFDAEDIAREWFNNYNGFAEDLEESVLMENSEDELTMRDVVKQIVDRFGNYKYQYNLKAEEYTRYGFENTSIYNKKFLAPNNYLALFSMLLHKAPTVANLEGYFDPDELLEFFEKNPTFNDLYNYAQSVWWGDGDDFIISVDNLTTGENLYEAEYEDLSYSDDDSDYDFDDEELDEAVNSEAELVNGYKVFKADSTNTWFVMDGQSYHNAAEFEGKGYPTKEQAIERANSLEKGTATDLEEIYHKDSFGQSNWYENVDDVMHDYEKGWLTKARAMEICDEEGWEFYDDLEEAITPDIESEELKALAQKHNITILDAMNNGDLRMEGAGADLMKFYQEAEQLGLWEVDPELYEEEGEELEESVLAGALLTGLGTSIGASLINAIKDLFVKDPSKKKSKWIDFKGHLIEKTPQGEIFVYDNQSNMLGKDISFHTVKQAKKFIKDSIKANKNADKNDSLEEAHITMPKSEIDKLDKEVEDAAKEVAQYNIKLKQLSDGSVEPDFSETPEDKIDQAKAALDRYNKAIEARPDRAKDIITYTEALHGKEEIDEFTQLANKLGFTTMAQMQHIMNAAKSLGKSELEMLKDVSETFDGKIPDTLIDGLTDTFLVVAEEVGLESNEDYQRFVKEEVEPGETITQAILRYRDEIKDLDINESVEKLEQIAVLNINKESVLDAIANAKAYVQENKFPQAKDSLNYASKLLDNPLEEGAMSNLDLEIKEVGSEQDWKDKANKELAEMEDALHYLKTYAPKEVGAGGNFDSIQDLNDSIEDLEKDIGELKKKLNYVNSIKRIGG